MLRTGHWQLLTSCDRDHSKSIPNGDIEDLTGVLSPQHHAGELHEAEVLRFLGFWRQTIDHHGFADAIDQCAVVGIGRRNDDAERPVVLLDDEAAFRAGFAAIGGFLPMSTPPVPC